MTLRAATEAVVLAVARGARRDGADLLAIAAPPRWTGPERLTAEDGPVRVVPCVSALAVRELRAACPPVDGEVVVILTDRDERDLGDEVVAALWRREVLRPSGWEALRHLFRVDLLHPRLADSDCRWLVDVLVDLAPAQGYPPPTSGVLDQPTAWRALLHHVLGIEAEHPSIADLVRWAARDGSGTALGLVTEERRASVCARIASDVGAPAGDLLRLAISSRNADIVPFGLVCGALWGDGADERLAVIARARFEGPLDSRGLDLAGARAWADAAEQVAREARAAGEEPAVVDWAARAEAVLASLDAGALAVASPVLRSGFTQRIERAGHALLAALDDPSVQALDRFEERVTAVRTHLRADDPGARSRVDALAMALRLTRRAVAALRSGSPADRPVDLADAARRYLAEDSWVDRARIAVAAEGETAQPLAEGYARLTRMCADERAAEDREFAGMLAAWSAVAPTGTGRLLPIERVLDQLVVPLARRSPVLLLVVDGLSYAAAHHLVDDITRLGWRVLRRTGSAWAPVVATLPTVTVHSRASLLTGRLASGDQDVEREGFAAHVGLRDAARGQAPRLFHKRDLRNEAGGVGQQVRDTVLDVSQRVVGVVVNAVDDHLARGGQLRLADGLHGIGPLGWLLDAAAEAGRAVVLTSDHGHVRELGSRVRPAKDGGERWHPTAAGPAGAGEVEIAGPRVLTEGGRIVACADESLRYTPERKLGYHGGAAPQEALCPLAVFAPGMRVIDGYEPAPLERPEWWDGVSVMEAAPAVDKAGNLVLFADPSEVPAEARGAEWVTRLLASAVLIEQRRLAGRVALDDQRLAELLGILTAHGDVVTSPTLERATGLPPARLRTTVGALRRLLNVDAYEVITIDGDGTLRLNRDLLLVQFGLR